jgi:hypothetical protein
MRRVADNPFRFHAVDVGARVDDDAVDFILDWPVPFDRK